MSKPQAMHDPYRLPMGATPEVIHEDRRSDHVGGALFAGVMMMISGACNMIQGLVALSNARWFADSRALPVRFDHTASGWIWLIFGSVVATAGFNVLGGGTWARIVGIVVAALNAIVQPLFIPAYPFWAMTVIAVDIVVIWGLAAHGGDLAE